MKKAQVILIVFGLLILQSTAQITFENSYEGSINQSKIDTKGNIYYLIDSYNNQCKLYNLDHSLWKTIDISSPQFTYIYDVQFVSQKLFNDDDLVEFVVTLFEYKYDSDSSWYYDYTTKVINEDGMELLVVEDGAFPYIFNDGQGSKLLIYIYDYSISLYPLATEVYHLPGTQLSSSKPLIPIDESLLEPYPNPSTSYVIIPYTLEPNIRNAKLVLVDISGKTIDTFNIDQTFNNLKLDIKSYAPGMYAYWVEGPGYKSQTKKFIIK